jgi:peptidoglycan/xylan/chitin deacetylase (PgdA/CDA1 family)
MCYNAEGYYSLKNNSLCFIALALCAWILLPQSASAHPREQNQGEILVPAALASRLPLGAIASEPETAGIHAPQIASVEASQTVPVSPSPPDVRTSLAPNQLSPGASLALVKSQHDWYWTNAEQMMLRKPIHLASLHQDDPSDHSSRIAAGDPDRKEVALTFDDGPHPAYTARLLEILKQYHAKATFFVVGEQAERNPELIRAEIAAGDSVGNHTYDHVSLVKIPQAYVGTEIKACGEVLKQITGRAPHLFRPPGGAYNDSVTDVSQSLGYTMVLWTDDPGDYASPGDDVILSRLLGKINNGSIILLHDGVEQTISILPQLLQYLKDHGYQTVTVDEMLHHSQN